MPRETQDTVGKWIQDTFPGTDPESPRKSLRALEEMVELCLASGASQEQVYNTVCDCMLQDLRESGRHTRKGKQAPEKIPVEAADVLIVLYGVAHMRGFDLHDAVDSKMMINRSRKWAARGDGTGYHIKEDTPQNSDGEGESKKST
jgi:hypothetical protein